MDQDESDQGQLFSKVLYYIDESVPYQQRQSLRKILDGDGAREYDPERHGVNPDHPEYRFPPSLVTHHITLSNDGPEIKCRMEWESHEGNANIYGPAMSVTPDWVRAAKRVRAHPLHCYYSPDPNKIFSGLVVTCTGLPLSDKEAIYGGVSALGGQWRENLTKEVTHVVALVLEGHKCELAMSEQGQAMGIKVVLPHWFDDCFKLRALLPETQYAFPDPPLLNYDGSGPDPNRRVAYISSGLVSSANHQVQAATRAISLVFDTDPKSRDTLPIRVPVVSYDARPLAGKTIFLSADLEIHANLRYAFRSRIVEAGGKISEVYDSEKVDLYVGKFREGTAFHRAARKERAGKGSVASLTWLWEILAIGRWRSPKECLLWWPVPKEKLPGFEKHVISITNYTGLAREYLKALIQLLGGAFTASMSTANTHLIAAAAGGDKYLRAPEWNIAVVNHLWLEDCYRHWCDRVVSERRYNLFPQNINFTDLLGTKGQGLVNSILDRWIGNDEPSDESIQQSHQPAPSPVKVEQMDQFVVEVPTGPVEQVVEPEKVRENKTRSLSPVNGFARSFNHDKATPVKLALARSERTPGTGSSSRMLKELPVDNILDPGSRRRAADDAVEKVGLLVADANEFQKEKKRKSFNGDGRPRKLDESRPSVKSDDQENEAVDGSNRRRHETTDTIDLLPRRKIPKVNGKAENGNESHYTPKVVTKAAPRILITGIDVDESRLKKLKAMHFVILDKPDRPTHLVANKVARTVKFLCAMATVDFIVTSDWLDACLADGKAVDESAYALRDESAEFESQELMNALKRAGKIAESGRKLLEGQQIYFTKGVKEASAVGHVVIFYGGTVIKSLPSWRSLTEEEGQPPTTFLVSIKQDRGIWRPLMEKAKGQGGSKGGVKGEIKVWSKDLILRACLFQEWPPSDQEGVLASERF